MTLEQHLAWLDQWGEILAASDQTDLARLIGHATYLLRFVREEEVRRDES